DRIAQGLRTVDRDPRAPLRSRNILNATVGGSPLFEQRTHRNRLREPIGVSTLMSMARTSEPDTTDYMAAAGCFCMALREAARKITRLYDSRMQESGVRITQFTLLSQLMLRGEMPIGKLAGILGMERTTLTRNLALLQEQKWITA